MMPLQMCSTYSSVFMWKYVATTWGYRFRLAMRRSYRSESLMSRR
jgi:hypothetical protein